jgi:hypothetical protein
MIGLLFSNVRPAPDTGAFEFVPSKGEATAYIIELCITVLAFAYALRMRSRPALRGAPAAFVVTTLVVALGGMMLCNLFSVNSLLDKRF